MKNLLYSLLMVFLFLIQQPVYAQQASEWKAMEDFHIVMGATFHPSEENNLGPLKEKAVDLLDKARAWKNAAVPQGYNSYLTKPVLKKLVQECKSIREAVEKNKSDTMLKILITKAHETFHEIKEKCRK